MRYVIDVANSEITWTGFLPRTGISGRVLFKEGIVETDIKNINEITGGRLVIDLDSIETLDDQLDDENKRKLTNHLKSEEFFDEALYPAAEFTLLEVKAIGDRADSCNTDGVIQPTHEVIGELNLKGIKQRVSALVNLQMEGRKMRVQTMFTLDRAKFGMTALLDKENGSERVLPDMEIMVKLSADALQEPQVTRIGL